MESFAAINNELRLALTESGIKGGASIHHIASAENIANQVRSLIPIEDLRSTGSFFTGDLLAEKAISNLPIQIEKDSICFDATCGVGNLLIAASKKLPMRKSLDETLEQWGHNLRGFDLHPEFVECTKLRLINEAISRGAIKSKKSLEELEEFFVHIRVGDIFNHLNLLEAATHLLINPPYNLKKLTSPRSWGGGKLNLASVFTEEIVKHASSGSVVTAILPDVLRSGSRYGLWRDMISSIVESKVELSGRFDSRTDVDVFNLYGYTKSVPYNGKDSWIEKNNCASVGDYFGVCTGPLVAYRDKQEGTAAPFIQPRALKKWSELEPVKPLRKTKTRLIKPPFVVINRTSSPSDTFRAAATIVKGKRPIAVENHLIVLSPYKGGLKSCRKLLKILKDEKTNSYLNRRIRCRHLTVGAVAEIPVGGQFE